MGESNIPRSAGRFGGSAEAHVAAGSYLRPQLDDPEGKTMYRTIHSKPAAATGAVSAVALFLANGQGGDLAPWRDVVAAGALTMLVVFAAYLAALIRQRADGVLDTWLAATVLTAAAVGSTVKLASGAPEEALHALGTPSGSPTATAYQALATALTTTSLIPLALFGLAVGTAALRTGILPRWLGIGALVTGVALAVNGCFTTSESVPAMLLLLLVCLAASLHLLRTNGTLADEAATPSGATSRTSRV